MVSMADKLVDAGRRERLEECRRVAGSTGESLDRVIVQKDYLDEASVLEIYAGHLGYEFQSSLEGIRVPPDFVDRVPVHFTRNYNLVALETSEDGALRVATCAPLDPRPMDDLSALLGQEIEPILAPRNEITNLIARAYRHKSDGVGEALADVAEDGHRRTG